MQVAAEPDLRRYSDNHIMLANRLGWLWGRFLQYQGTGSRNVCELENFVLQTRLACEQFVLLLQSACFGSLPGTEKAKTKEFSAVKILAEIETHVPHLRLVPLTEIRFNEQDAPIDLVTRNGWAVNRQLFKKVYDRGGDFLHLKNRERDIRQLENYLNNAINLVAQLIYVTWRHVVLLDGLAQQIVSQILPGNVHTGFVLQATDEHALRLKSVLLNQPALLDP